MKPIVQDKTYYSQSLKLQRKLGEVKLMVSEGNRTLKCLCLDFYKMKRDTVGQIFKADASLS